MLGSVSRTSSVSTEPIIPPVKNFDARASTIEPFSQAESNPGLSEDGRVLRFPGISDVYYSQESSVFDPDVANTEAVDGEVMNMGAGDREAENPFPEIMQEAEQNRISKVAEASDDEDALQVWQTQDNLRGYSELINRRGSDTSMRCYCVVIVESKETRRVLGDPSVRKRSSA